MDKIERLEKLKGIVSNCYYCELGETRKKSVFGEGNHDAICTVIAEAPGQREDEIGRPFVGRSGQLLRKILISIGLDPINDVFIANIVKCRPPGNRAPTAKEIDICVKFLKKQIEIIKPKLIVLLGKTAVKGICPNFAKESMEKLRSITKSLGMITYEDIPIIITYHHSALLRTPWRKMSAKEDFQFFQEKYKELKYLSEG